MENMATNLSGFGRLKYSKNPPQSGTTIHLKRVFLQLDPGILESRSDQTPQPLIIG
jgi:hypothetical protein